MPTKLIDEVSDFDFLEYEQAVQSSGRSGLKRDNHAISEIQKLNRAAQTLRVEHADLRQDAKFIHQIETISYFASSQSCILINDKPRYEPYAAIPSLRYILRVDSDEERPTRGANLDAIQDKIWITFQHILDALVNFEVRASLGQLGYSTQEFDPSVSRDRRAALAELRQAVPSRFTIPVPARADLQSPPWPASERSLLVITSEDPDRAAIERLLVFPQTTCHDEVAFIRLIQLAECLFWGALVHVQAALQSLETSDCVTALRHVTSASEFAGPIVKVFRAVRTMPPAHFLSFRHTTNHASAIQSISWQLLDAHVYGLLPEKESALRGIDEIAPKIEALTTATFLPLVSAVRRVRRSESSVDLGPAVIELDHGLRAWRKFHERQLAGHSAAYLPVGSVGTGGTSGYEYLARQKPPRLGT